MKTTKQILTEARDMALKPNVLSGGKLVKYSDKAEDGYCFCALGLIAHVSGHMVIPDPSYGGPRNDLRFAGIDPDYTELENHEAVKTLARAITQMNSYKHQLPNPNTGFYSNVYHTATVYGFNDWATSNNRLHEVVDAFNKAIELSDAQ